MEADGSENVKRLFPLQSFCFWQPPFLLEVPNAGPDKSCLGIFEILIFDQRLKFNSVANGNMKVGNG